MPKTAPGFTLIEYLIYVAILAVFLISSTAIMLVLQSGKGKTEAMQEVEQNGRIAVQTLERRIRNATSVALPATGASSTFIVLAGSTTATIGLRNQALEIKEGAAASSSLTSADVKLTDLVFENRAGATAPAAIHFSFTVSSTNPGNNPDYAYSQSYAGSSVIRRRP